MEVSMFKRLSEAHPVAVVYLSAQYRMNADIMMLSNSLIYSNRLHCGSRDVYSNRLRNSTLSDDDGIQIIQLLFKLSNVNDYSVINNDVALIKQNINCCAWLQKCVDPSQAVVFLNTDSCRYKTSELYDNVTDTTVRNGMSALDNKIEALIVRAIVSAFQMTGVDIINDIGIISPFRLQVKQIRSLLLDVCSNASNLQCPYDITALVNTVDKFQGRDKNIIIFSTVRSKSNSDEVVCSICI
jgi:DNA replication ATP-dependent helicase Dna2